MAMSRAADAAKSLLRSASWHLGTRDPTDLDVLSGALDESLDWDLGEPVTTGPRGPFEPFHAENARNLLAFEVAPGDRHASPGDRVSVATHAMRSLIGSQLGRDALHWFDERSEPLHGRAISAHTGLGAAFHAGVDGEGMVEASATYAWPSGITGDFPMGVIHMVQTAQAHLPGLEPFLTTLRTTRSSAHQQLVFDITQDTQLTDFEPLMSAFGVGHQHGSLMTLTAFVLGAQYTLPGRSSTLALMRSRNGIEMRLDVNLDALPTPPQQLLPLLRLPLSERPAAKAGLDRWLTAMTPEGFHGPGSVNVLSIRVRKDMPARLAVFLRPVAFDGAATAPETIPQSYEPPYANMRDEVPAEAMPFRRAWR